MSLREDYRTVSDWWEWSDDDKSDFKEFVAHSKQEADEWVKIEAETCRMWTSRGYKNASEFLDCFRPS